MIYAAVRTASKYIAGLVLSVLLLPLAAHAQNFSIDRYRIAGGGGSSTGGVFSVTGTIGQADASLAMVGGNYAVTGGFWSIIAVVQTVGSPTLLLSRTNSTVTISWDISTTGFTLQETGSLGTQSTSPVWSNSTGVVNNSVTVPISGNKYYRLIKP